MPDRAVIPLMPAVAGGFILGLIVSISESNNGTLVVVGVIGAAGTFLFGLGSVFRADGPRREKGSVGVLRAILAAALYILIYIGMIKFLRDAQMGVAIGLFALAILCGYPLARMRVRSGEELRGGPHPRPG